MKRTPSGRHETVSSQAVGGDVGSTVCLLKNELTTTHWLREPIGAVVKASLHRAIINVYGPEPG